MAKAFSIVCKDCNRQFRSAAEVQAHAEETFHTNFEESTEQILRLVCKTCGKPCRSKEEQELHSKRNPGHVDYVDETSKQGEVSYKPGDESAAKPLGGAAGADAMDVEDDDAELKKALLMSVGKDPAAAAEGGGAPGGGAPGEKVPVTDKVNPEILEQLCDMGFPRERAAKAIWLAGAALDSAVNWLAEHADDADIDVPLMVDAGGAGGAGAEEDKKPKLSKEEQARLLEERLEQMRRDKRRKEADLAKQQELARIQSNKEMNEALRKQKEQEEKLAIEKLQREKERDARDRARIKAELEKDKAERRAAMGIKDPVQPAAAAESEEEKRLKRLRVALGSKLRDLIGFHRNDPTSPNPATKAMETAVKYAENVLKNPADDKFRAINLDNAAFQRLVGGKRGGVEMMVAVGFAQEDQRLVMPGVDEAWLKAAVEELQLAQRRGTFY